MGDNEDNNNCNGNGNNNFPIVVEVDTQSSENSESENSGISISAISIQSTSDESSRRETSKDDTSEKDNSSKDGKCGNQMSKDSSSPTWMDEITPTSLEDVNSTTETTDDSSDSEDSSSESENALIENNSDENNSKSGSLYYQPLLEYKTSDDGYEDITDVEMSYLERSNSKRKWTSETGTSEKENSADNKAERKRISSEKSAKSRNDLILQKNKLLEHLGGRKSDTTSSGDEIHQVESLKKETRTKRKTRKVIVKEEVFTKQTVKPFKSKLKESSVSVSIPLNKLPADLVKKVRKMVVTKENIKKEHLKQLPGATKPNKENYEETSNKDTNSSTESSNSSSSSEGSYVCNSDKNDHEMEP